METNEIVIEFGTDVFEPDVVREVIRRQADIGPAFLHILEDIVADDDLSTEEHYTAYRYANLILAELRGTDAHIPLLQFCLLPEPRLTALLGDILESDLDCALAATSGGDTSGIVMLIENPDASDDVRIAGLRALVKLSDSDEASREVVVGALEGLFFILKRTPNPVWEELVYSAQFLAARELGPEVLSAWEDGLIEMDSTEIDSLFERCGLARSGLIWEDDDENDNDSERKLEADAESKLDDDSEDGW